jgi:anti-anti-sigma factor
MMVRMGSAAVDPESSAFARLAAQPETNPVVEQAKGIIMAQQRCGPEEAFDLLRRASQRANVKVTVIATRLIAQVSGQPPAKDAARQPPPAPAGTVVVTLPDEMTFANARQVRAELAAAFGPGVSTVIADGTATVFCDSAGIRELVHARRHAAAVGAGFRVAVPHHYLRDRMIRTGLAGYLPIYPALRAAFAGQPGEPGREQAPGGPLRKDRGNSGLRGRSGGLQGTGYSAKPKYSTEKLRSSHR